MAIDSATPTFLFLRDRLLEPHVSYYPGRPAHRRSTMLQTSRFRPILYSSRNKIHRANFLINQTAPETSPITHTKLDPGYLVRDMSTAVLQARVPTNSAHASRNCRRFGPASQSIHSNISPIRTQEPQKSFGYRLCM